MNLNRKQSLTKHKPPIFGISIAQANKYAQPLEDEMVQMALDFNSSPTLMELIEARRAISEPTFFNAEREAKERKFHKQVKQARKLNKAGEEKFGSETSVLHALLANEGVRPSEGAYVDFAISILQASAYDLVMTERALQNNEPGSNAYKNAKELRENTLYWLAGAESLFPFKECTNLLEQEIRLQSGGQVDIPKLHERSDELASWIANNPNEAKKMLNAYQSIFSNYVSRDDDDDADDELFFEENTPNYSRSMRVRHG